MLPNLQGWLRGAVFGLASFQGLSGEEREPGIHCLHMRLIKVSNHVELCGCVPLWHSKILWMCAMMYIAYYWDLVTWNLLVLCVGQQCLPSMRSPSSAVLQCSRSWLPDLMACWMQLTVTENDGLSNHACTKCVRQLGSLERAAEDLVNFRSQAVESYRALHHIKHEG